CRCSRLVVGRQGATSTLRGPPSTSGASTSRGGTGLDSAAMVGEQRTTLAVQNYLDQLALGAPAEPVIRALLGRAADRLRLLCSTLLFRDYRRLTRPPVNLQSDEMLSAIVERLLKAMREVRPQNVRQFFGLANRHMRWELNDLARRHDAQD